MEGKSSINADSFSYPCNRQNVLQLDCFSSLGKEEDFSDVYKFMLPRFPYLTMRLMKSASTNGGVSEKAANPHPDQECDVEERNSKEEIDGRSYGAPVEEQREQQSLHTKKYSSLSRYSPVNVQESRNEDYNFRYQQGKAEDSCSDEAKIVDSSGPTRQGSGNASFDISGASQEASLMHGLHFTEWETDEFTDASSSKNEDRPVKSVLTHSLTNAGKGNCNVISGIPPAPPLPPFLLRTGSVRDFSSFGKTFSESLKEIRLRRSSASHKLHEESLSRTNPSVTRASNESVQSRTPSSRFEVCVSSGNIPRKLLSFKSEKSAKLRLTESEYLSSSEPQKFMAPALQNLEGCAHEYSNSSSAHHVTSINGYPVYQNQESVTPNLSLKSNYQESNSLCQFSASKIDSSDHLSTSPSIPFDTYDRIPKQSRPSYIRPLEPSKVEALCRKFEGSAPPLTGRRRRGAKGSSLLLSHVKAVADHLLERLANPPPPPRGSQLHSAKLCLAKRGLLDFQECQVCLFTLSVNLRWF